MKSGVIFAFLLSAPSIASANCIGGNAFQTCTDNSGNNYTIQRYGNSTYMQGNNYRTGNSWSQQSHTFGNTTMHNGIDSDGDSWSTTCVNGFCN